MATATNQGAAPAAPLPVIVSQDALTQQLMNEANVNVEDMEKVYVEAGVYNHVPVGGNVPIELPGGKSSFRPKTLADLNPGLDYIWLSPEDRLAPQYRGYKPVSRSNAGGAGAPDHVFDRGSGLIIVDGLVYSFATKEYAESRKQADLNHLNQRLSVFAKPAEKDLKDSQGASAKVTHTPFEAHAAGENADKPTPGNNRKKEG